MTDHRIVQTKQNWNSFAHPTNVKPDNLSQLTTQALNAILNPRIHWKPNTNKLTQRMKCCKINFKKQNQSQINMTI